MTPFDAPTQNRPRLPGDIGAALDERYDAPAAADWRPMGAGGLAATLASGGTPGGGEDAPDDVADLVAMLPVEAQRYGSTSNGLTGTLDGVNAAFTLAYTPVANSVQVFRDGVRLMSGASNDYTLSGAVITFAVAPDAASGLVVDYWREA